MHLKKTFHASMNLYATTIAVLILQAAQQGGAIISWHNIMEGKKMLLMIFFKLLDLFREGYTAVNTKKVIYHLLHKWITDKAGILSAISNDDQIIQFLDGLPLRLMNVESSWGFENTLYDIRELAKMNQGFANIVNGIIGNDYKIELED